MLSIPFEAGRLGDVSDDLGSSSLTQFIITYVFFHYFLVEWQADSKISLERFGHNALFDKYIL